MCDSWYLSFAWPGESGLGAIVNMVVYLSVLKEQQPCFKRSEAIRGAGT
jgi:hypothetical protein